MSIIIMKKNMTHKKQNGFTLVEVMVAMVVFSVGLLGLAGLQSLGMTNNQTAYFRTVAMQHAYNMTDRMRNNVAAVNAGTYNIAAIGPLAVPPVVLGTTNCITNTCNSGDMASFDIFEWQANIAAELPQGRGSITAVPLPSPPAAAGAQQFVVCVMWNELKVPAAVLANPVCTAPAAYIPTAHFKFYTLRFEL